MDETGDVLVEVCGHQLLERRRGITVPLLHYSTHECVKYSGECGLRHILRSNAYLLICLRTCPNFGPVGSTSDIMPDRVLIRKGGHIPFPYCHSAYGG